MAPTLHGLGPLEMEILGLIGIGAAKSVADIQKELGKDLAYTTVMTVLSRLYEKGLLTREKRSRQFYYVQNKKAAKVGGSFLSKIKTSLFKNQRLEPILNLLDGDDELTLDELKELKKVVAQKLKEKNK